MPNPILKTIPFWLDLKRKQKVCHICGQKFIRSQAAFENGRLIKRWHKFENSWFECKSLQNVVQSKKKEG